MGAQEIRAYLFRTAVKQSVAASTPSGVFSALVFLCRGDRLPVKLSAIGNVERGPGPSGCHTESVVTGRSSYPQRGRSESISRR